MRENPKDIAAELTRNFAEATSAALSQLAGEELPVEPRTAASSGEAAIIVEIEITGALRAVCAMAAPVQAAVQLAAILMGEAAPTKADAIDAEGRDAAVKLFQQICGGAAERLRKAFGELDIHCRPVEQLRGAMLSKSFWIRRGAAEFTFEFRILQTEMAEPETTFTPSAPASSTGSGNSNLDLLLDIELGVSLRFGSRQMLLKDVLDLCSGSVVELDRQVRDPVDLLVDGRLIAQGEVVIVGGNYGLRITRVATPGERIACLP